MKHKLLSLDLAQVQMDGAEGAVRFSGYASVYGGIDSYGDRIAPGAYAETLVDRERAVALRWNHWGPVIGKWLEIKEDDTGLWVEGELTPGHSVAKDAAALIRHGAISGLSIGYRVRGYEEHDDYTLLTKIELIEISIVEEPADNAARIGDVKGAIYNAESLADYEAILREAGGFSRSDAAALVSGIKGLTHGERVAKEKTSTEGAAQALRDLIAKL